jgi:hypothetical protein
LKAGFVVNALGQLLQSTIRQTDCVARTGEAEFTLATGTIHSDSARNFAQRICHAVANANLIKDERIAFVASCGMVAWPEDDGQAGFSPLLPDLRAVAKRRAQLGMDHALSGVVGRDEEDAFKRGNEAPIAPGLVPEAEQAMPDVATLLLWLKEGKQEQVMPHLSKLSDELLPLVELMRQQKQR